MCDCILSKVALARLICVADFCGTCHHAAQYGEDGTLLNVAHSHSVSYWADYDPHTSRTHYGGAWQHVPDLVIVTEPTEVKVYEHAYRYGSHCQH